MKIRKVFDHICMVIAAMFILFFCIDRVNSSMGFMSSTVSKELLLIFSISVMVRSALAIYGPQPRKTPPCEPQPYPPEERRAYRREEPRRYDTGAYTIRRTENSPYWARDERR